MSWFQILRQLAHPALEEELKETFLTTLREPLRTTFAVVNFKDTTIEQVIDWVQVMDSAQTSNRLSMASLQRALPKEEDLRFWQGVQCTTCLNPGHSTVECTI